MLGSFLLVLMLLGIIVVAIVVVVILVASAGRTSQPQPGAPPQYPPQYPPAQYQPPYPAQHQPPYPSQYPPQYPVPAQRQPQYPPQSPFPYAPQQPAPYTAPRYPYPAPYAPAPQYPVPGGPAQPAQRPAPGYPPQAQVHAAPSGPYAAPQQQWPAVPPSPSPAPSQQQYHAPMPTPMPTPVQHPPAQGAAVASPAPVAEAAAPAAMPAAVAASPTGDAASATGGQPEPAQPVPEDTKRNSAAIFDAAAVTADPYAPPLPSLPVAERITLDPPAVVVPSTDLAPHDVYLSLGAESAPQLADLAAQAPALADPVIQGRIQQFIASHLDSSAPDDLHPLGLDMPQEIAVAVAQRIRAAGGDGTAAPSAYREPLVPLHQALAIAHGFLAPQIAAAFPDARFTGVISYWGHGARWWVVEGGIVYPDGRDYFDDERMMAYVDKLNGHIWSLEEIRRAAAPGRPDRSAAHHATPRQVGTAARPGWATPRMDDNPQLYLSMGAATIEMGDYALALQIFDRAIQLGVDTWEPYWGRSRCLDLLGRRDEALEAIRQAEARNADPAIIAPDHCALLIHMGRNAEALSVADQFLASHPPVFFVVANRARALFGLQRYADALAAYDQALSIAPPEADRAMLWSYKGRSLVLLNRFEEANATFDRAIALGEEKPASNRFNADKDRQQLQADNWRIKAFCLAALKRYDEAIAAFDRGLALAPNDVQALTFKARTFVSAQRYTEAYDTVSRALPLKPDDVDLLVMNAVLAAQLGKQDDLQVTLHRLRAIDPTKAAELSAQLGSTDSQQ